jgi:membrane protein DedA with SNARE-associated domain
MEGVFEWVARYGYAGIFLALVLGIVGLPVPDETLLVFCGYLVSQGRLHPAGAFLAALAGSWCGISTSYAIGRYLGFNVARRFGWLFHLDDQKLEKVHQWFHRTGHWALFVGYYIAGVRHFTAIVAGASRLEYRTFITYAWTGGALWVALFLSLGYYLGENWRAIAELVHRYVAYASVALLIVVGGIYWLRRRRRR